MDLKRRSRLVERFLPEDRLQGHPRFELAP
jgi:hypothetical protein